LYIQWGYSNFFPALTISSHVTSWGKQSIKFRTDVAMMDKLGYDIKVSKMTDEEVKFSKQAVKNYNRLNNTIWFGDLYRIVSPYEENRMVVMYVNEEKSKAVLFNYNLNTRYKEVLNRVRLQGLDSHKQYKVEETNLVPGTKSNLAENGHVFSGDYLMTMGLNLTPGKLIPLTSMVIEISAAN
jgi:alpha-galactosidase